MAVVQNLYQIFKLPASFLVENNCDIKKYTIFQGLKDGNVVSIGDNIVFQQLRYLHGNFKNHKELFNKITRYRNQIHIYKKHGEYKKARVLEQYVCKTLFVSDIVNVIIDRKKSDFHKFRNTGFTLNGVKYVYFCSGAGQIRRNTATFINEQYKKQLTEILNCGLDKKTNQFVLAKYTAYFALAFSSILWVRTPRVCVISDFYRTLKNVPVDYIEHDESGKAYLLEKHMDLELNCADGQGLIDPYFAELWAKDMELSFIPCSFVCRSCFIKGNLATFDFKEYAHKNNIFTIRDKWGKEYNIDDIDILLSESQFKTLKYYNSWDEYNNFAIEHKIHWGVARYNKKQDPDMVLANYQYIQALSLSTEDIQGLIAPTIKWLQQVCSGDPISAMLYSFGPKSSDIGATTLNSMAQTMPMKAIIKNIDMLNDSYVQRKIYKNISESINHAKLGKIWIRGNYQFMISDPVAQVQSALGLEPVGLLKENEIYSNFWLNKYYNNPNHNPYMIDCCRSPMIDVHEHNPMKLLINNSEADYWYRYLNSGIIYNIYDTSTYRHEDADFDGDIIMTTDNFYFLKGSHKDHNIITYTKGLAVPAPMTTDNITKTVIKGFGSGVGGFSNSATIMYTMAAMFEKPEQQEQHKELMTRIKLLREIVGQEIDRIKGADKPSLPQEWRKFVPILPSDSPEEKKQKYAQNTLVISKKPYFFRYLYPELNQRFKQFEASYNQISRDIFGIKFKKLLKKENKTEEEKNLIRRYRKYSPLITAPSTMNKLCREFESVDFDIKYSKDYITKTKKNVCSKLPTYESRFESSFDQNKYNIIKKLYQTYCSKKQIKHLSALLLSSPLFSIDSEDFSELRTTAYDALIASLQNEVDTNNISGPEFLFYTHKLSKTYSNFNWGFAWDVLADQIFQLIPYGPAFFPVRDDKNGTYEYLGQYYSLKDITNTDEIAFQHFFDILFGFDNDGQIPDVDTFNKMMKKAHEIEKEK